jgi:hypothetical protein
MEAPRVLLVGESNPYGSNPEFALYCHPSTSAGGRLQRILGLDEDLYLALHRQNLCDGDWSKQRAVERAWTILSPTAPWNVVVLLGRKVASVFETVALGGDPIVPFSSKVCCPGMTLVSLPHPSGRNAAQWSDQARRRTREILQGLVPEIAWGSFDAKGIAA